MDNSNTHNQRIAKMTFASVYPGISGKYAREDGILARGEI